MAEQHGDDDDNIDGIQLTDRKPFETQSNRLPNNNEMGKKPQSTAASTTVARADQKAFLKRVLANKQSTTSRSTVTTTNNQDQKAYLRQILASKTKSSSKDTDSSGSSSTAASSTRQVQDQRALLRKVLASRSAGKREEAHRLSNETKEDESGKMSVNSEKARRDSNGSTKDDKMTTAGESPKRKYETQPESSEVDHVQLTDEGTSATDAVGSKSESLAAPAAGNHPTQAIDPTSSNALDADDYATFLDILKREVAGDHSELWRGFRSLFRDDAPPPRKKPKRTKFDAKTKKMLTEMNLCVKRSSQVECVVETQLVNDRKLGKENEPVPKLAKGVTVPSWVKEPKESATNDSKVISSTGTDQSAIEPVTESKASAVTAVPARNTTDLEPVPAPDTNAPVSTVRDAESVKSEQSNLSGSSTRSQSSNEKPKTWMTELREKQALKNVQSSVADTDAQSQSQPRWMTELREKRAMAGKSLLDQSMDSQPDESFSADQTEELGLNVLRLKPSSENDGARANPENLDKPDDAQSATDVSSREPLTSSVRKRSLLDTVAKEEGDSYQESCAGSAQQKSLLDKVAEDESLLDNSAEIKRSGAGAAYPFSPSGVKLRGASDTCGGASQNPWANIKLRPAQRISSQSPQPSGRSTPMAVPLTSSERDTQVMEEQRQGPTRAPLTQPKDNEDRPPWTPVKLQAAASRTLVQPEDNEEKPPWSPVKLRSVAKNDDGSSSDTLERRNDPLPFRQMLRKVPSELNVVKQEAKQTVLVEKTLAPLEEENNPADNSSTTKAQVLPTVCEKVSFFGVAEGDEIDIASLPAEAFGLDSDGVIVELGRIFGMAEGTKVSVVIGKKLILTARSVEGERLSRVTWCLPRSNVKSLTLDLAAKRADLALDRIASKSLVFATAEACLSFANAFYEQVTQPLATVPESRQESSDGDNEKSLPDSKEDSSAEQLNEEEQKLLEAYRQKRRTKAPDEAMRETMAENVVRTGPQEAPQVTDGTMTGLDEEEEKTASTYRKMLKFSVPPDAVRHKMMKDGVSEKIMSAVLDEPGQTEAQPKVASSLSDEDEKVADSYRKMLKLRIPPDAVRHKMMKDQVDSRIVDAVLGSSSDQKETEKPPASDLSPEEEELVSSYRKMLKMMIPADAVRHKMKKDQASGKVVIAVFGSDAGDAGESKKEDTTSALSEEEETIASSYRKMLKMMIPPDAVRHKMKKDAIDSKIVIAVLGEDPNDVKKDKPTPKTLSEADEQVAESYRKMLRMKVPPDGVRHKMIKNGISEEIISAVLGAQIVKPKPQPKAKAPGSKLVSLHWTPLSGEALDNSVWRASKKRKASVAQPEGSDISKLVELFQKKRNNRVTSSADGGDGNGKGSDKAKILELNRANNLAISLKAFKEFSHKELADTIAHIDPLHKIVGERVQFMKDLLPTPAETKAIKAYKGDDSRLVPAESFFRHMVNIPRLQTKVQVMQTMDTLKDNASELGKSFVILEKACSQIMSSEKLEEVLDMVLQIGNIMNEGTRTGGAAGFKFDSLLKLTQTKSSDGKMTVLDYIVMIFVAKDKRDTLHLISDFPDCQLASRMLISDMVNEVVAMNGALKKCKTELDSLKKDNGETVSADSSPRAGLLAAIKKRGGSAEKKKTFTKRAAFLDAIEERAEKSQVLDGKPAAKSTPTPSEEKPEPKEASLKSGIQRLEAFISEATEVMRKLEEGRDRAIDACKSLSRYCGESGGERATSTLIGILSQFASNLEDAIVKHDVRRDAEQRREAAQKKKEQQGTKTAEEKSVKSADESGSKGHSLVLMVNELLKEAPETAKEDFKKGVVYENPDDKLRAIYQKERETLGIFVPPDARKPSQVDLLIAIKKRRERAEAATSTTTSEK